MNVAIQAIQINLINIYRLNTFPEERIKNLISELNVHYEKINNYIESEITGEKINIEVIDSLAKLNEITRLAPYNINHDPFSGDFRLGIDLLESVIALLNTRAGHSSTQEKLLGLGWDLLNKLYNYSFEELVDKSLLYKWLKRQNLIRTHGLSHWERNYVNPNGNKLCFSPTEEEIESFYNKNRQRIYEYMVFRMSENQEEVDPLSDQQAINFYHYYQTLSQFKI